MRRFFLFVLPLLLAVGPACQCDDPGVGQVTGRIEVRPGVAEFGTVCVGDTARLSLTVVNAGTVPLDVTGASVEAGGGTFAVESVPTLLAAGEEAPLVVTFAPSGPVDFNAALTVTSSDRERPEVRVMLSGAGDDGVRVDAVLLCESADGTSLETCEPAQRPLLNFGDVALGAAGQKPVVLSNLGCAVLTVSAIEIAHEQGFPEGFSLELPELPIEVSRVQGASLVPTLTPEEAGTFVGALKITWADGVAGGAPFDTDAGLIGNGVEAMLIVRPSPFRFDQADISNAQTQTFVLENTGGLAVQIDAIALEGANPEFTVAPSAPLPLILEGYTDFSFDVTYAPTDAGSDQDVVVVTTAVGALRVPVSGGAFPSISVDPPATIEFGAVDTGASATETITISNTGRADLVVDRLELTTNPSSVFTLVGLPPLPKTLAPGASMDVSIRFTDNPTIGKNADGSGQSELGELAVYSDDPDWALQAGAYPLLLTTDTQKNVAPAVVLRTFVAGAECFVQPCSMDMGQAASFDASASSDPEGDPLTFAWELMEQPGGTAALSATSGAIVNLVPDFPNRWKVKVTISDPFGNTATGTSEVSVRQ